ncbi:hypothetical protein AWC27_19595 [Mycobacterium szulgai]|uniref:Uncharacterized protein n=1 Tax=Mycobacterium szulgai TaxID=1787 RepID=A0A1X2FA81_MYCSZ|nr:hypothetical protein [Mycobacterium szulgai]ORX15325.1 hypothetical protein AWC27_19595 [Mycobacterium szulgai]
MTLPTPTTSRPGTYAALRVTRNPEAFQSWWPTLTDTTDITDAIAALHPPRTSDVESSLHWLMITVFQGAQPVSWLDIHGLHPTAQVTHVLLDAEVAHDNDGDCVGVDIVLSLHVTTDDGTVVAATPSAYIQWPATAFALSSTEPHDALAEIIDTALDHINTTIATADRFNTIARALHDTTTKASEPQDDSDDEHEIEHCRGCGRVTRIDDDPVDTDAADGWNGYCGSCADRRETPYSHDDG